MLQRYCKLVILGTLGTLGHAYQAQQQQLEGSSDVYLQKKINLIPQYLNIYFKESCNLIGQEYFG